MTQVARSENFEKIIITIIINGQEQKSLKN
jgi:hypothetical protein